jgi:hypothetical protein
MSVPHRTFREQVLATLKRAKIWRTDAHIHLLYTPELHDPLPEATDARREAVRIRIPNHVLAVQPEANCQPRLITLDTRRVRPYLLEHDPALDDPLLESSINQAHDEAVLGVRADAQLDNSDPELATGVVGGWIVGEETASEMAQRIGRFSAAWLPYDLQRGLQRRWVRLTQPHVLCGLWPLLNAEQRADLLGTAEWVAFDASGQVRTFAAERNDAGDNAPAHAVLAPQLNAAQAAVLRNLSLVQELLPAWRQFAQDHNRALPADAEQRLHFLLQEAQRLKLPDSEVPVYALTAAPLPAGATQTPEWQMVLERAQVQGPPLLEHLQHLPPSFWQQWLPSSEPHRAGQEHNRENT